MWLTVILGFFIVLIIAAFSCEEDEEGVQDNVTSNRLPCISKDSIAAVTFVRKLEPASRLATAKSKAKLAAFALAERNFSSFSSFSSSEVSRGVQLVSQFIRNLTH